MGFPPDQIDRLARLNYVYEFRDQHDEFIALLRKGGVDPNAPRIVCCSNWSAAFRVSPAISASIAVAWSSVAVRSTRSFLLSLLDARPRYRPMG